MSVGVFCSWSGGKDSILAMYTSKKKVEYLVNMINEEGGTSRTHYLPVECIQVQSQLLGKKLVQQKTSWEEYEKNFKSILNKLKNRGVKEGVFGDIDIQEHREWVERVTKEVGIISVFPLWQKDREELIEEFINLGFKGVVVAVDARKLGKEFVGEEIDEKFVKKVKRLGIDVAGERGEYHTFVYDGPIFTRSIKYKKGEIVKKDNYWILEIKIVG